MGRKKKSCQRPSQRVASSAHLSTSHLCYSPCSGRLEKQTTCIAGVPIDCLVFEAWKRDIACRPKSEYCEEGCDRIWDPVAAVKTSSEDFLEITMLSSGFEVRDMFFNEFQQYLGGKKQPLMYLCTVICPCLTGCDFLTSNLNQFLLQKTEDGCLQCNFTLN